MQGRARDAIGRRCETVRSLRPPAVSVVSQRSLAPSTPLPSARQQCTADACPSTRTAKDVQPTPAAYAGNRPTLPFGPASRPTDPDRRERARERERERERVREGGGALRPLRARPVPGRLRPRDSPSPTRTRLRVLPCEPPLHYLGLCSPHLFLFFSFLFFFPSFFFLGGFFFFFFCLPVSMRCTPLSDGGGDRSVGAKLSGFGEGCFFLPFFFGGSGIACMQVHTYIQYMHVLTYV